MVMNSSNIFHQIAEEKKQKNSGKFKNVLESNTEPDFSKSNTQN